MFIIFKIYISLYIPVYTRATLYMFRINVTGELNTLHFILSGTHAGANDSEHFLAVNVGRSKIPLFFSYNQIPTTMNHENNRHKVKYMHIYTHTHTHTHLHIHTHTMFIYI